MPNGVYRRVFLIGRFAVKTPRLKRLFAGLRCNRWEREMWQVWRPVFGWENLCLIIFADLFGLFVVMPRAVQSVSFDDVVAANSDYYPDITAETKIEDYGIVENRVLVLDYGLPDVEFVQHRRAYYIAHSLRAR